MRPLLLLLLASCAGRVTVRDVALGFHHDVAALRPAPATSRDMRPLRMEDAEPMSRTIALGEKYLEQREKDDLDRDYVCALLASAYLTQGRTADARKLTLRLVVPPGNAPERERATIRQVKWLASACHAMHGRLEVDAMLEDENRIVDFLEQYGVMAGFELPRKHDRDYLNYLERQTFDLQAVLFAPEPRSPVQLEARTRRIQELRRILAELVYNDAAALKENLRDPDAKDLDATDVYFSMALSSLYVTLSYLSDDLIPRVRMIGAQKQWLWEQAQSSYEAVRGLARHYLAEERMKALETGRMPPARDTPEQCRERLYARLYIAQKEVQGWITIRGE
jgi:hypothetical protein